MMGKRRGGWCNRGVPTATIASLLAMTVIPIEIVVTGQKRVFALDDPVIHLLRKKLSRRLMDARIKSGHDERVCCSIQFSNSQDVSVVEPSLRARHRHSGMVPTGRRFAPPDDRLRTRPQMRNCASGNLEIPGSMRSLSSGRASRGPVGIAPE